MFMYGASPITAEAHVLADEAAGVFVWKPEDVGGYAAKACNFFAIAPETSILGGAAREALRATRGAVTAATAPEVV